MSKETVNKTFVRDWKENKALGHNLDVKPCLADVN